MIDELGHKLKAERRKEERTTIFRPPFCQASEALIVHDPICKNSYDVMLESVTALIRGIVNP